MKQDIPTATSAGEPIVPRIHGLDFRRLPSLEDERGETLELFRLDWGFHAAPVPQIYHVLARPGSVRAWVHHKRQMDRIAILSGSLTWGFYDDRADSPTRGTLVVRTFSERSRHLFNIPPGVWHGVKNTGVVDATFANLPDRAYDHADPDKYRLPLKNDLIPFDFSRPYRGGQD
jgi:dTDP-4-dehydrorhamnose 3,5-epimerase